MHSLTETTFVANYWSTPSVLDAAATTSSAKLAQTCYTVKTATTRWLSVLDNKLTDLGTVLAAFSESSENRIAVAGLIANGVDYQPFVG